MLTINNKHTQDIPHGREMVKEAEDWLAEIDAILKDNNENKESE